MAQYNFYTDVNFNRSSLVRARINPVAGTGGLTSPLDGEIAYDTQTGSRGLITYDSATAAWARYARLDYSHTITGTFNFNPAAGAPFSVGSTTKVTNLNADLLDGLNSDDAATASTIAARYTSGRLKVGAPVDDADAVNLGFFTSALENRQDKVAVKAATTGALASNTITGNVITASANAAFPTIDGVTINEDDSILVLHEGDADASNNTYLGTSDKRNGIYTLTDAGANDPGGSPWVLTRRNDADEDDEMAAGATVFVDQGTVNIHSKWTLQNSVELTTTGSDGDDVIFFKSGGNTHYKAGNGMSLVGDTFHFSGATSYTAGDIFFASSATAIDRLAAVSSGNVLLSAGASTAPAWGKVGLTTHVSGILPIANGGTNSNAALNNGRLMYSSGGSIVERAALTAGAFVLGDAAAGVASLAFGTGNQLVGMNSGGNGVEFKSFTVTSGGAVTGGSWTATAIGLAYGGTNADLSAAATGGLIYKGASALAASGALTGLVLGNGSSAPTAITAGNSSVLVTNGSGVPSWATDLPTAVTIGGAYVYRVGGTDVAVADGGTGASTLTGVLYGNGTSAFTANVGTAGTHTKWAASAPYLVDSILAESGVVLTMTGAAAVDGSAPPTFTIRSTTSSSGWTVNAAVARLDFRSDDPSGAGAGTRARIEAFTSLATGADYGLKFYTETGSSMTEKWQITPAGVFQAAAAQTIQTAGAMTLATTASNGSVLITPNGTGLVDVRAPLYVRNPDSTTNHVFRVYENAGTAVTADPSYVLISTKAAANVRIAGVFHAKRSPAGTTAASDEIHVNLSSNSSAVWHGWLDMRKTQNAAIKASLVEVTISSVEYIALKIELGGFTGYDRINFVGAAPSAVAFSTTETVDSEAAFSGTSGRWNIQTGVTIGNGASYYGTAAAANGLLVEGAVSFGSTLATADTITVTKTALGTTSAPGIALVNSTAATSGNQQVSPGVRWQGQGWKTDSTAASRAVEFRAYILPVQGTANPTGIWKLQHQVNSGGWSDVVDISTAGGITAVGLLLSGLTASKAVFTDGSKNLTSSGTVGADQGGTGQSSYTVGDLLYASASTTLSKLAGVATGNVLISGGVSTAPSWGKVVLGTHTTGNYVSSLTGTSNQINVSGSTGDITLSLPQNIHTSAQPTFAGLTVNGLIQARRTNSTPTTPVAGAWLATDTPATVTDQAIASASLHWYANAWDTDGATTTNANFRAYVLGVAGATVAGEWRLDFQADAGAYANALKLTSGGVLDILTGFRVNGSATSGNVLRGNGTNFVSAQLGSGDISNSTFVTSVSGTTDRITSSGGLTPVIDIAATYVGQTSITTLGTIATGVWSGTTIAVNKGGTGLTSGTSGGVLYYSASGTLASSGALAANGVVLGGGAGSAPSTISTPASSVLMSNGSSVPTWGTDLPAAATIGGLTIARRVSSAIGNGSSTSFSVTHNLGTKNVKVGLRKVSDDTLSDAAYVATSTSQISVDFNGYTPSTNEFEVIVIG